VLRELHKALDAGRRARFVPARCHRERVADPSEVDRWFHVVAQLSLCDPVFDCS
jgi:hypothetical protein